MVYTKVFQRLKGSCLPLYNVPGTAIYPLELPRRIYALRVISRVKFHK